MNKTTASGIVLSFASAIFWGSNYIAGRALMSGNELDPVFLSMIRYLLGGALLFSFGILFRRKKLFSIPWRVMPAVALQNFFGLGLMGVLMLLAQGRTSAVNATMLEVIIPLLVMAGSGVIGIPPTRGEIIALIPGTAGCLLAVRLLGAHGFDLTVLGFGDFLLLCAGVSWMIYVLSGRKMLAHYDSMAYSTWGMLTSAGLLAVALFFRSPSWGNLPQDAHTWWIIGYIAVVPTALCFWFWNLAQQYTELELLNATQYLCPASAVVMAHYILGESLDSWQWLGTALIVSAIFLEPGAWRTLFRPPSALTFPKIRKKRERRA